MLYILLLIILSIMYISYKQNKMIVFSPSFICSTSFLIADLFLIYLKDEWRVSISEYTVFILFLGLSSLLIGESLFSRKIPTIPNEEFVNSYMEYESLHINKKIVILIIIVDYIIAYIYYKEVINFMGVIYEWSDSMSEYRMAIITGEESVSTLVSQLKAISTSTTLVFLSLSIHNIIKGDSIKNNLLYIIGCIPYMIMVFLQGGRIGFLSFVAIILWYTFIYNYFSFFTKVQYVKYLKKFCIRISLVLVLVLAVFYSVRLIVGRANTEETSFSYYIGEYIGAPTMNLDRFLSTYSPPSLLDYDFEKSNALQGLSSYIYRNKPVQRYGASKLDFRIGYKGVSLGNVYTAFSRYYADLGLIGIIFFPICLGALLMKFLSLIFNYNICFCKRHLFFIMLYAFFYNQLVVFAADDTFFTYFRLGNLEVPILFYFINKYLVKVI